MGVIWPERGAAMRPLGDGFIKLIRMLIGPIIFTTIAVGIANMGEMKDVGRIGVRALIYFETVSNLALIIGLVVVNVLKPGVGLNMVATPADIQAAANYGAQSAQAPGAVAFFLNIIPTTIVDAFARGDILQVLLVATLAGVALLGLGARVEALVNVLDQFSQMLFAIVGLVMRLAPIGAFGAMAFTVGRYGIGSLLSLGQLMAGVYITCLLFIIIVLGSILRVVGLGLDQVPPLHRRGDPDRARHLVVGVGAAAPDGEDGAPRVQQAGRRARRPGGLLVQPRWHRDLHDDGRGLHGAGERRRADVLAAAVDPRDPDGHVERGGGRDRQRLHHAGGDHVRHPRHSAAALALLVGVDRFMSEARAITNLIGNAVATVAIARWDRALDLDRARRVLDDPAGNP